MKTFEQMFCDQIDRMDGTVVIHEPDYGRIQTDARADLLERIKGLEEALKYRPISKKDL